MPWPGRVLRTGERSRRSVRGAGPAGGAVRVRPRGGDRRLAGGRGVSIAVNLAPMIDVSFLLLIFFLVTTTFERAEGVLSSRMPRDAGTPAVALPISPIVVRLTQTGPGHEDFRITIDHFEGQPATVAELAAQLRAIHQQPGFDQATPVLLVPDSDVRWDHVTDCWNAAIRVGCQRVAFSRH